MLRTGLVKHISRMPDQTTSKPNAIRLLLTRPAVLSGQPAVAAP